VTTFRNCLTLTNGDSSNSVVSVILSHEFRLKGVFQYETS